MGYFDDLNAQGDVGQTYRFKAKAPAKKKPSFFQSMLPSAGGIGGGAAGAAIGTAVLPGIGTLAGALLGSAIGGGAGKVAENKSIGEGAFNGVGKEAAIQGALGAGPIRLLKAGAGIARGAKAGSGLVDALKAGGAASQAPSMVKTAVADKLGTASENLASKALGVTKGQKNKILETTGEKAGSIAKRYGITQASDVPAVTKPLYDQFNTAVKAIPRTFSKDEVGAAFKGVYEPMIAKGQPLGQQAIGNKIKEEAENLLKGVGAKGMSATELNAKRQAFDKLAYKAKGTDPALYDVNNQSRKVLANLIHSATENAGIKTADGMTTRQLGREIQKVEKVGKAAAKNQEGAGGSMALPLGVTPGAVVGSAGGPLGSALGIGANMALNSATGRRAASAAIDGIASKTASSAAKGAANPYDLTSIAKRVAPVGLAGALVNQSASMSNPNNAAPNMPNTMNTNTMDPLSQGIDPMSSAPQSDSPLDPANVQANVEKMIQAGAKTKDIKDYLDIVSTIASFAPQGAKGLNSTAAGNIADTKTGLSALSSLQQDINSSNANNPLLGALRGRNPLDTNAQTLQAKIATVKQIVGKALEGGVLRKEDEAKYAKLLPTMNDTDAVANAKIIELQNLIGQRLYEYQAGLAGGSGGVDQSALGL